MSYTTCWLLYKCFKYTVHKTEVSMSVIEGWVKCRGPNSVYSCMTNKASRLVSCEKFLKSKMYTVVTD